MNRDEALSVDLAVVGGGPTGIALGAEAVRAGLTTVIIEQGPLLSSLLGFPVDMVFFTTREKLEIAGVPFAIPHAKPTRREAIAYYHSVVKAYSVPLALHQRVQSIERDQGPFVVRSHGRDGEREFFAEAVVLATGYFETPRLLNVPGEEQEWVHDRYRDPLSHFGERVVVVGGGNSAVEAAIELWRAGAEVTVVHRGDELKPSVKYWLKPDFENRVAEGSFEALYRSRVLEFAERGVRIERDGEDVEIPADAAYVLIGYEPDVTLHRNCGIEFDPETLVPFVDPETCESNVPGLYIAGTLQAGRDTNRIFIENSRVHSERVVGHLASSLKRIRESSSGA